MMSVEICMSLHCLESRDLHSVLFTLYKRTAVTDSEVCLHSLGQFIRE
jgi:hypothetical protein